MKLTEFALFTIVKLFLLLTIDVGTSCPTKRLRSGLHSRRVELVESAFLLELGAAERSPSNTA